MSKTYWRFIEWLDNMLHVWGICPRRFCDYWDRHVLGE